MNKSKSINPEFNYEEEHDLFVTKTVISKIWEGTLDIFIYGQGNEAMAQLKNLGDMMPEMKKN